MPLMGMKCPHEHSTVAVEMRHDVAQALLLMGVEMRTIDYGSWRWLKDLEGSTGHQGGMTIWDL